MTSGQGPRAAECHAHPAHGLRLRQRDAQPMYRRPVRHRRDVVRDDARRGPGAPIGGPRHLDRPREHDPTAHTLQDADCDLSNRSWCGERNLDLDIVAQPAVPGPVVMRLAAAQAIGERVRPGAGVARVCRRRGAHGRAAGPMRHDFDAPLLTHGRTVHEGLQAVRARFAQERTARECRRGRRRGAAITRGAHDEAVARRHVLDPRHGYRGIEAEREPQQVAVLRSHLHAARHEPRHVILARATQEVRGVARRTRPQHLTEGQ